MMRILLLIVVVGLCCIGPGVYALPYLRESDLPEWDAWKSLSQDVEFLPSPDHEGVQLPAWVYGNLPQHDRRRRRRRLDETDEEEQEQQEEEDTWQYRVQPFVEGVSDYDEYQQAWRMLGFMIDCDDFKYKQNGRDDSGDDNDSGCQRFVVWAAYVDLEYEGNGIGEYQYWDPYQNSWDSQACDYTQGSRCAKMDCHLSNTHFSLLGFFKHRSYDDWMEQLFKHEGMCIWQNNEYAFMKNAREAWPQYCTSAGIVSERGEDIYYDVKPLSGGSITVGLYTDERCVKEYQSLGSNDPITVENILGNFLADAEGSHDSGDYEQVNYNSLSESYDAWNQAFDIFKICHPCVAYNLFNYGYSNNNMQGANYGQYDDDNYANGDDFDCYDDAGYTNVNQCMKFCAKTEMNTATFRDVALATAQGTLVGSPLAGYLRQRPNYFSTSVMTYLAFAVSCILLLVAVRRFLKVRRDTNFAPHWSPTKPLVFA